MAPETGADLLELRDPVGLGSPLAATGEPTVAEEASPRSPISRRVSLRSPTTVVDAASRGTGRTGASQDATTTGVVAGANYRCRRSNPNATALARILPLNALGVGGGSTQEGEAEEEEEEESQMRRKGSAATAKSVNRGGIGVPPSFPPPSSPPGEGVSPSRSTGQGSNRHEGNDNQGSGSDGDHGDDHDEHGNDNDNDADDDYGDDDADLNARLRRFFPANAVIPRGPAPSLFTSPGASTTNAKNPGEQPRSTNISHGDRHSQYSSQPSPSRGREPRRCHPRERPWSTGPSQRREHALTRERRRRQQLANTGVGVAAGVSGISTVGVGGVRCDQMARRKKRRRRPHTVSTGLRDMGFAWGGGGDGDGDRGRGGGGGGAGAGRGGGGASGRGENARGAPLSEALGGTGDGCAVSIFDAMVSTTPSPEHEPRKMRVTQRVPPMDFPMLATLRPEEGKGARDYDDGGESCRVAPVLESTPSPVVHDWRAPRGCAAGGALVGLTAEALGRSGVLLDGSGRVKLVEQVRLVVVCWW